MTPNNKTKLKGGAQIRTLSLFAPAQTAKRIDCENYVEGLRRPDTSLMCSTTTVTRLFASDSSGDALITVTWAISSTNMTTPGRVIRPHQQRQLARRA